MQSSVIDRIFEYDNYRFFLRDYFAEQKTVKRAFSHRFFASKAGFASSSFCAHVIEGKRNLAPDSLHRMLKGLGISGRVASFFENLVFFNQSKTIEDREAFFRKIEQIRRNAGFYKVNNQQYAYYDEWYYPVIRELAVYAPWGGDFKTLGKLVIPVISPEKARLAIETLVSIGLLGYREDGTLYQSECAVTAETVPIQITRKTRKEFLLRALESIDTMGVDKRHVSGVTAAMTAQTYSRFIGEIDELRKRILSTAAEENTVDAVYQFNFQALPLSQKIQSTKSEKHRPGDKRA
jgi:uncharacterized protein (TIGR02147 family)